MITEIVNDVKLVFETNEQVFSPSNLDKGTLLMLSYVTWKESDKVLDLGCGYGLVGILAAKKIGEIHVVMCDILKDAVELAKINAKQNHVENIRILESNGLDFIEDSDFTLILSNPPYHVDFSVPKKFIENSYKKLLFGGKLYMVTKRKEWYKNKFISVFGGVKIEEKDGYYIFIGEKRNKKKENMKIQTMSKKLKRKYIR